MMSEIVNTIDQIKIDDIQSFDFPTQLYIVVINDKPQAMKIIDTFDYSSAFPILVDCSANPIIFCSIEEAKRFAEQTLKYAIETKNQKRFPILTHGYEIHAIQSSMIVIKADVKFS